MKVVIVGSTHAGTQAALKILRDHPETAVTIYERQRTVSFLSSGISLFLDGQVKRLEEMFYTSPDELTRLGATVKTQHNVLRIDADKRRVAAVDMTTGRVTTETYDKLIMATGSTVNVPPIRGIEGDRVLLCKDYEQAKRIYQVAKDHHRITIVGGGYIGTELAESYARTGHAVRLIQSQDQLLDNYVDANLSAAVVDLLTQHGVEVVLNRRVVEFEEQAATLAIKTATTTYHADFAIVCTGFVPNTRLLRGQVEMDRHGAILIDDYLQTSDPNILACGDASVVYFNPIGRTAYAPLASSAVRQGILAGTNVFGRMQRYLGTQATSAIALFGHTLASTGLTLRQAQTIQKPAASVTYRGNWRPTYMPRTDVLTINLVYSQIDRRILGAQLFSKHEVAQSANAVSLAIQNRNTIDDLAFVDLLFNPNFDAPFNYLNLVAQLAVAQEARRGNDHPRLTTPAE
ncbi:FAD-dependent oxidoreductase [Levilactobacillus sp. HBUAS70063]|uniref:FAD-dependent oxidoreductase n=1 Tax=Levilactobacillus sp. HBUAS70063 TaxID=3109359 RepID=UPI003132DFAC